VNVARILAHQERFERAQNRSKSGSEEAFSESGNGFVGLYANEGPIEISFHDRGLEADDFQI
jgi:hypothetical protein